MRPKKPNDPFALYRRWFRDAQNAGEPLPEAMALATATRDGRPSVRMVLNRGVSRGGFVFYTNYTSRKAVELIGNPHGRRRKARRSPGDRFLKMKLRARRSDLARARFRVRRSGEASGLSRIVSSSGRVSRIACTIVCFSGEKETSGRASSLHRSKLSQFPW